jgi:hypothetical protein
MDYQKTATAIIQRAIAVQEVEGLTLEPSLIQALREILEERDESAIAIEVDYLFGQDQKPGQGDRTNR